MAMKVRSKNLEKLHNTIKCYPDWPIKGVNFKDLTPIMYHPEILRMCINELGAELRFQDFDVILSSESRGFWFSVPLALFMDKRWVHCRKKGKLQGKTIDYSYKLEYGEATLSIQEGSIKPGDKVLVLDDILATGGTVSAMIELAKKCGAEITGTAFIVNLNYLPGEKVIKEKYKLPMFSLLEYDSE